MSIFNKRDVERKRAFARTAEEAKRYSTIIRTLGAALGCMIILTAIVYIVSILYSKYGSFTVSINKYDANLYGLSLCEIPDFPPEMTTVRLNCKANEDITNISVYDLPGDLDAINGVHNGDNYVAYTFYMRNSGENTVTFEYYLYIANVTNDVDTAARIRLYENDVTESGYYKTYARVASNGEPEAGTEKFESNRIVARRVVSDYAPGQITRYTVVLWLEGDDPDCVDKLIGGSMKLDMVISIIEGGGKA